MFTTARSLVAFSLTIALAACARHSTSASSDRGPSGVASTTSVTIRPTATASAEVKPSEPDPVADLHSLDEVTADSIGKTVLVRLHRGSTKSSSFTGHECGRTRTPATFEFAATDVDLVRALSTGILPKSCARVFGKVTGKARVTNYPLITVTKIYDVAPQGPAKPADGADFANLDDVNLDKNPAGKIVELSMWRGPLERGAFAGHDCRNDANLLDMVKVTYGASQAQNANAIGAGGYPKKCSTVRVKLTKQGLLDWNAELLDVKG